MKAASDIVEYMCHALLSLLTVLAQYAPISGTVEAINEELSSSPSLLNKSPEGEGT